MSLGELTRHTRLARLATLRLDAAAGLLLTHYSTRVARDWHSTRKMRRVLLLPGPPQDRDLTSNININVACMLPTVSKYALNTLHKILAASFAAGLRSTRSLARPVDGFGLPEMHL